MSDNAFAYGGVVIDSNGRLLLREPTKHYGGYVWTFPKGHPEPGETDEEAALRETEEETGVIAQIVARIPGVFPGDTTQNIYFLMRPTGEAGELGDETARVQWATPDEARELIRQTPDPRHQERGLEVLEAALAAERELGPG